MATYRNPKSKDGIHKLGCMLDSMNKHTVPAYLRQGTTTDNPWGRKVQSVGCLINSKENCIIDYDYSTAWLVHPKITLFPSTELCTTQKLFYAVATRSVLGHGPMD